MRFLFLLLFSLLSINGNAQQKKGCKESFQSSLFTEQNLKLQQKKPKVRNKTASQKFLKQKEKEIVSLIQKILINKTLSRSNKEDLVKILTSFPSLIGMRINPQDLPQVKSDLEGEKNELVAPLGWGLFQLAAYFKNVPLLETLLKLDPTFFYIRTNKMQGNLSLEQNALHISIHKNFKEGVNLILSSIPYKTPAEKNAFIDEKTLMKETPWVLAVERDLNMHNLLTKQKQSFNMEYFSKMISSKYPSGEAHSWDTTRGSIANKDYIRTLHSDHALAETLIKFSSKLTKSSSFGKDYKYFKPASLAHPWKVLNYIQGLKKPNQ